MLRLIFVTDATAAGRLWSIRQNHPESGSDVLNVYHCQQRVYEEIYVKEQVSLDAMAEGEVLDALRRCQPDTLTPIEAMGLLYELKQKLR